MSFNVGDEVECVDSSGARSLLTKGKRYTVLHMSGYSIDVVNDRGVRDRYLVSRFVLATAVSPVPVFNVGDEVEYVDSTVGSTSYLTKGKRYTVVHVWNDTIDVINDKGTQDCYLARRFLLATAQPTPPVNVQSTFNIGDDVVCTHAASDLTQGNKYRVFGSNSGDILIMNDRGTMGLYAACRFVPASTTNVQNIFSPGETVVCTDASASAAGVSSDLTKGGLYLIIGVYMGDIHVMNDVGVVRLYSAGRFALQPGSKGKTFRPRFFIPNKSTGVAPAANISEEQCRKAFRPTADAHTCGSCGAPRPCNYHD